MAFLWPQVWAEEEGCDKTLVDDLGTLAICTCSLHLPSGCACFWSQMYETSYNGLLLGPPKLRLPKWSSGKESACQIRRCKRHSFDSWIGKIPGSRRWQPTPGKSCARLCTAQLSRLLIWWVWYQLAHNEQLRPRGHLILRVLRIIPNKFIQSHLSVTVLASAFPVFLCFVTLVAVPLNTPSLEQLCFLGLIHLLKHAEKGHGLFLFALIQKWFIIWFVLL